MPISLFEKYRLQTTGETKYWSHCSKPFFFSSKNFVKAAKFFWNQISKKKKQATRFGCTAYKKIFTLIRPDVLEKKGKNFFLLLENRFWENSKYWKIIFSTFLIMNYFRFYCIVHCMGIFLPWKKKLFVREGGGVPLIERYSYLRWIPSVWKFLELSRLF